MACTASPPSNSHTVQPTLSFPRGSRAHRAGDVCVPVDGLTPLFDSSNFASVATHLANREDAARVDARLPSGGHAESARRFHLPVAGRPSSRDPHHFAPAHHQRLLSTHDPGHFGVGGTRPGHLRPGAPAARTIGSPIPAQTAPDWLSIAPGLFNLLRRNFNATKPVEPPPRPVSSTGGSPQTTAGDGVSPGMRPTSSKQHPIDVSLAAQPARRTSALPVPAPGKGGSAAPRPCSQPITRPTAGVIQGLGIGAPLDQPAPGTRRRRAARGSAARRGTSIVVRSPPVHRSSPALPRRT